MKNFGFFWLGKIFVFVFLLLFAQTAWSQIQQPNCQQPFVSIIDLSGVSSPAGGSGQFSVDTRDPRCTFSLEYSDPSVDWVGTSGASGPGTSIIVTVTTEPNLTGSARTVTLRVKPEPLTNRDIFIFQGACIPSTAPTTLSGPPGDIAPGSSTTLIASGGTEGTSTTYEWFTGGCGVNRLATTTTNSLTVSPTSSTTYYVRRKGLCGTTTCTQIRVNVCTPPIVNFRTASNEYSFCRNNGRETLIGTPAGGTFTSTTPNAVSGNRFNPSAAGAGNHAVTYRYTNPSGCPNSITRIINVKALPDSRISGPRDFCPGDTVSLQAPNVAGNSYLWSTGATTSFIFINTPGTYSVTVTGTNSCSSTSSITVPLSPSADDRYVVTVANSFTVNDPLPPGASGEYDIELNGPFDPILLDNDGGGFPNTIVIPAIPTSLTIWYDFDSGTRTNRCRNSIIVPFDSNGAVLKSIIAEDPSCSGIPAVVENFSLEVNVQYALDVATITPEGPVELCPGEGVELNVSPTGEDFIYTWFRDGVIIDGFTRARYITNKPGSYQALVQRKPWDCGRLSNAISVKVDIPTTSEISGPDKGCVGSSGTYSVINTTGSTYRWRIPQGWTILSPETNTNEIEVQFGSTDGEIRVIETNANNCSGPDKRKSVTTNFDLPVTSDIAGPDSGCVGSDGIYSVTNSTGSTYNWEVPPGWTIQSGQGTNQITVIYGSADGDLEVAETNTSNCIGATKLKPVITNALPVTSDISGPDDGCISISGTYSVTNSTGSTYNWEVPPGWTIQSGQGSNQIVVIYGGTDGDVEVTETNTQNCVGTTKTKAVTINAPPVGSASPPGEAICTGQSVDINLNSTVAGTTFTWTAAATPGISGASDGNSDFINQVLTNSNTTAGTVTYTVTPVANGCQGTPFPVEVMVNPLPVASINNNSPISIPVNGSVMLAAQACAGCTYQWNRDGNPIPGAIGVTYNASLAGAYTVTTTANSCAATSAPVIVITETIVTVTADRPLPACSGQNVTLTADVLGNFPVNQYQYQWFLDNTVINGAASPTFSATVSGTYRVEATEPGGGDGPFAATIEVTFEAPPVIAITNVVGTTCQQPDGTVAFNFSGNATTYQYQIITTNNNQPVRSGAIAPGQNIVINDLAVGSYRLVGKASPENCQNSAPFTIINGAPVFSICAASVSCTANADGTVNTPVDITVSRLAPVATGVFNYQIQDHLGNAVVTGTGQFGTKINPAPQLPYTGNNYTFVLAQGADNNCPTASRDHSYSKGTLQRRHRQARRYLQHL